MSFVIATGNDIETLTHHRTHTHTSHTCIVHDTRNIATLTHHRAHTSHTSSHTRIENSHTLPVNIAAITPAIIYTLTHAHTSYTLYTHTRTHRYTLMRINIIVIKTIYQNNKSLCRYPFVERYHREAVLRLPLHSSSSAPIPITPASADALHALPPAPTHREIALNADVFRKGWCTTVLTCTCVCALDAFMQFFFLGVCLFLCFFLLCFFFLLKLLFVFAQTSVLFFVVVL